MPHCSVGTPDHVMIVYREDAERLHMHVWGCDYFFSSVFVVLALSRVPCKYWSTTQPELARKLSHSCKGIEI